MHIVSAVIIDSYKQGFCNDTFEEDEMELQY